MKTLNKLFFVLALIVLSTTSCSYLEEDPITSLGVNQIFSTEMGIRSALIGCYVSHTSYHGYGSFAFEIHANSIILESSIGGAANPSFSIVGNLKPEDASMLENLYSNYYITLNRVNNVIENIQTASVSEAIKKRYLAEAKFLRASVIFDLVRTFGRIPMHTSSVKQESDANIPRSSMSKIYLQILSDLNDAEDGMPTKEQQVEGQPHKWAATAFKARVYLYLASMTQDHLTSCREPETIEEFRIHFVTNAADPTRELWQMCFDNAKKVKDAGVYELVPQYSLLWNGKSRNTKESIFELQFSPLYGEGAAQFAARTANNVYSQLNGIPQNGNSGRVTAGRSTFIENWKKYGNGKYLLAKNADPTAVVSSDREEGADPRINTNYVYYHSPYFLLGDKNSPEILMNFPNPDYNYNQNPSKFLFIRKYQSKEMVSMRGNQNLILFRYSDLLLILAEAANELDDRATMKECIEEILIRARNENTKEVTDGNDLRILGKKQPVSWDYDTMSKDSLRLSIMQEREFELLGEGQELFDVRRRGTEYLKYRMNMQTKWLGRQFVPNNYEDPNFPGVWEGWGKTRPASGFVNEAEYTDEFKTPEYLIKSLFLPIPAKEFRINRALNVEDQNIGWW